MSRTYDIYLQDVVTAISNLVNFVRVLGNPPTDIFL